MIFRAISQNRTSDAVIDQIERLILEGVLRSGDQLPAERDLANKLDVSRPVLRTALKELEERNLIRTQHGGVLLLPMLWAPFFLTKCLS